MDRGRFVAGVRAVSKMKRASDAEDCIPCCCAGVQSDHGDGNGNSIGARSRLPILSKPPNQRDILVAHPRAQSPILFCATGDDGGNLLLDTRCNYTIRITRRKGITFVLRRTGRLRVAQEFEVLARVSDRFRLWGDCANFR